MHNLYISSEQVTEVHRYINLFNIMFYDDISFILQYTVKMDELFKMLLLFILRSE